MIKALKSLISKLVVSLTYSDFLSIFSFATHSAKGVSFFDTFIEPFNNCKFAILFQFLVSAANSLSFYKMEASSLSAEEKIVAGCRWS